LSLGACVKEEPPFDVAGLERGVVSEPVLDELLVLSESSLGAGFGGGGAEAVQSDDMSSLDAFSWEGSTGGVFAEKHAVRASTERRANPRMRQMYHPSAEPAIVSSRSPPASRRRPLTAEPLARPPGRLTVDL
jgi:hypothetical protein